MRAISMLSFRAALLIGSLGLMLLLPPRVEALDELPLKAAVIFNLLLYVEWPGEAEQPPGVPLSLCADRRAPLWPHLKALNERPLRQWRLELRDAALPEAQRACRIWVLEDGGARPAASRTGAPLLTIAAGTQPVDDSGAVIALQLAGSRLQFDIDMAVARQQGLLLSSKVLRLARSVRE